MQYFSTNRISPPVSFREATLKGQPDDKGLFFPTNFPKFSHELLKQIRDKTNEQTAFEVIKPYVGDAIPENVLFDICSETVNFPFPLKRVSDSIFVLELFHGPTLAFKDVGARFMSRCLQYFSRESSEKTVVVVATSGDTGGAVAAGFHGVEGIEVVILYPKGKVSRVQELQLTTLGGNVTALEVAGTFDDCQKLAKQALGDADLQKRVFLTSANSINVARWLPQQFYYLYALKQWDGEPPVFSVPSGNFGNVCAGLLAHASGLPAAKFIAACNANDVIPKFLESGEMKSQPSVQTMSNAMDVGDPSNFVRILEIFDNDLDKLREKLVAVSISDAETAETMREVYKAYDYVLDPHGAVGCKVLSDHLRRHPGQKGIFLETAHPVKFDSVGTTLGIEVEIPTAVGGLFSLEKHSIEMNSSYDDLREVLLSRI